MMARDKLLTNRLLSTLPETEYERLKPHLTTVDLPLGKVLYEAFEEIDTVYFPHSCLISLVSILENGATTEVGLIGRTGMVGLPVVLGSGLGNHRAIIQVAGEVRKISAVVLKQEFYRGEELQKVLLRYVETRLIETAQLAVCNCHHTIEERLARWLLMVQDLLQSNELPLTQQFLSHMLGVRRSSVTVSAGILQQAGLIRYSRGRIAILDRQGLEYTTCECYEVFRQQFLKQ